MTAASDTPVHTHDHASCRNLALDAARRLTERRGLKLTETRARVLDIVAESHKPIGAYDILQRLSAERGRAAPPTASGLSGSTRRSMVLEQAGRRNRPNRPQQIANVRMCIGSLPSREGRAV